MNITPAAPPGHRPLLMDPIAERDLTTQGWTSMPFLTASEVTDLTAAHARLHPEGGSAFDTDFGYLDLAHRQEVASVLRPVFERHGRLEGLQVFNHTFIMKWSDERSALPLHQDWTYVDETRHRSISVWIPLVDVAPDLDNGPVAVLPGSHVLPTDPRGIDAPTWFQTYADVLAPHLEPIAVPAGSALIFDNRILHASEPNRSGSPRLAICAMAAPSVADLRYTDTRGKVWSTYAVDREFFVENPALQLRSGPATRARLIEQRPAAPIAAPLAELAERCGVELVPRAPRPPGPVRYQAGAPLGGGPVARRDDRGRDTVAIGRPSRTARKLATRLARLVPDLADAATGALNAAEEVRPTSDAEHWGPWRRTTLRREGRWLDGSAADHFSRLIGTDRSIRSVHIDELGPNLTVLPSTGAEGVDLVSVALACPRPLGSSAIHAGPHLLSLFPGAVTVLDPTVVRASWSVGSTPLLALVIEVARPRLRTLR